MCKSVMSSLSIVILLLLPLSAQAFDIDRDLGVGELYVVHGNADAGWRIEGSFSADYDIEFFICDAENYTRWDRKQSAFLYEHDSETTGQIFNFTIPYDSEWYVVFSNVQLQIPISLQAEVYYVDQSDVVQTQVSWFSRNTLVTPLFIGILLIVPIVLIIGVCIARKREPVPAVSYEEILSKPDQF